MFFASGLAFAGDEAPNPPNPQTKTTSEANAGVIFNQGDNNSVNTTQRQFTPAVPAGPTTYVIPGPAPSGKTEKKVVLLPSGEMTLEEIENASRRTTNLVAEILLPWRWGGKKRVYPVVIRKSPKVRSNVIKFVDWNPYQFGYNDDVLLGAVTVVGEAWWPEMRFVAEGVKVCQEDMGAVRVALLRHEVIAAKTETSVKGLSLGGASVNGSNDVALGSAIGYGKGTSTSYPETWPVYEMVCMNDGPNRRPAPTVVEAPPPPPPVMEKKTEVNVNVPEIKIKIEHVYPESVPISRELTPRPAPEPRVERDVCSGIPPLSIYFPFDVPKRSPYTVDLDYWRKYVPDFEERLGQMGSWLEQNPSCSVQIEGHTCSIGTYEYNAALGRRRGIAAEKLLTERGIRVKQRVSAGEDYPVTPQPTTEKRWEDRRVILRIIGEASGN